MPNSVKRPIQKLIDQRASDYIDEQVVWLGDYSETVQAPEPGLYYARQINGKVIKVFNAANVPPTFDLQVRIGRKKSLPNVWQIIAVRETYDTPAGGGQLASHHEQHEFPNFDTIWSDRKQILPLTVLVQDAAGFVVQVFGAVIHTATGIHKVATQLVDLSSYVVTAGAKFVSIETDDEGVLSVHDGVAFGAPEIATDADIPVPVEGKYLIAFVLFYDSQTELSNADIRVPFPLGGAARSHSHDAAVTTYTPAVLADWDYTQDPGEVDEALDQLAKRLTDVEGVTFPDAADVTYTPVVLADWDYTADPGDVQEALDQLAERLTDVEAESPELLAYQSYAGGDATTTSATQADADATNLVVTFTAPTSGKVLVRLTAQTCPDTGANHQGAQHQWGLRESTTDLAGPHTVSRDVTGNGFAVFNQASKAFVITGLTPGSSHTYKWAHNVTASGTARIGASSSNGEAVMEVWALP